MGQVSGDCGFYTNEIINGAGNIAKLTTDPDSSMLLTL